MSRERAVPLASRNSTEVGGDYRPLVGSFRRSLLAANRSPATVETYLAGLAQFGDFLVENGMPTSVAAITREHVESFITFILSRRKAATAESRYGALHVFFDWLVEEGEITASPMAHVKRPVVPE